MKHVYKFGSAMAIVYIIVGARYCVLNQFDIAFLWFSGAAFWAFGSAMFYITT